MKIKKYMPYERAMVDGKRVPLERTLRSFSIYTDYIEKLAEISEEEGQSINTLTNYAVYEYIRRYGEDENGIEEDQTRSLTEEEKEELRKNLKDMGII